MYKINIIITVILNVNFFMYQKKIAYTFFLSHQKNFSDCETGKKSQMHTHSTYVHEKQFLYQKR